MEEKLITCINCPMGCRVTVQLDGGNIVGISGNSCKRGETYARQECIEPLRIVTAVIPVQGSPVPLSVKTASPIPKAKIHEIMKALARVEISAPVEAGSVVASDICGTGVDVIATKSL